MPALPDICAHLTPIDASTTTRRDSQAALAALVADADTLMDFADTDTRFTAETRVLAATMAGARYAKAGVMATLLADRNFQDQDESLFGEIKTATVAE